MIRLHVNVLNSEHEVVIFGNTIVVDVTAYTYEELDSYLFTRYPHLDIAKIKETFELNKRQFPNENKDSFKLTKLSLPQLVAIAFGTENQDMMAKLVKHKESFIRSVLATRSDLSEDLQLILARDKHQNVLGSLALNKSLTFNAFNTMLKNADLTTKEMLALRLNNNDKMLEILAKDKDIEVRRTVYQRKGLSQYLSEYLSEEFGNKESL